MRKPLFPLQFEPSIDFVEQPDAKTARITDTGDASVIRDNDMRRLFESTKTSAMKESLLWLRDHQNEFGETTVVADFVVSSAKMLHERFGGRNINCLAIKRPLNTIIYLDDFLAACNELLATDGYMWCHSRTAKLKKESVLQRYPKGVGYVVYFFHYLWHRVCPRVRGIQKIYFGITGGKDRTFHRVELMGRAYRAGFEVLDEEFRYGEFFLLLHKIKDPIVDDTPSEGPIIKLNRVGKYGQMIGVYKFRTMHPYSEYIQNYIYKYNDLKEGGKFANDYRINSWGKLLRSTWLDELPMILNIFKGQLKLVGVRPLSRHYYSLYSPEMQQLRIKVKPGLLPPFYYEKKIPETIEEIEDSERRYTEAYLKHPLLTDIRYFFGIMWNIIFKRRKSA